MCAAGGETSPQRYQTDVCRIVAVEGGGGLSNVLYEPEKLVTDMVISWGPLWVKYDYFLFQEKSLFVFCP